MIALTRNGPLPPSRNDDTPVVAGLLPTTGVSSFPPNRADRAVAGGQSKPLTRNQKTTLVLLAQHAFDHVKITTEVGDIETFRHNEAITACGRRISEARNEHFSSLKSHFLNLAGQAGRAFNSAMRSGTEDNRLAMVALERSCAERGLRMDYPAAICWRQYKCKLDNASAKQLWQLNFTVRNRRKPTDRCRPVVSTGQASSAASASGTDAPQKRGRTYVLKPSPGPETDPS